MAGSVYKVVELVGTSSKSWDKAAANAIERAGKKIQDLRIAEVQQMDIQMKDDQMQYRVRLSVSFKVKS